MTIKKISYPELRLRSMVGVKMAFFGHYYINCSRKKVAMDNEGTSASGGGLGKFHIICKIPLRLDHEVIKRRGKHRVLG